MLDGLDVLVYNESGVFRDLFQFPFGAGNLKLWYLDFLNEDGNSDSYGQDNDFDMNNFFFFNFLKGGQGPPF